MPKQLYPPETRHFLLSPHLFRQRFYRHYSIRVIIGSCSIPIDKQVLNKAILQNKCKQIKGFTYSIADKFVFIIEIN